MFLRVTKGENLKQGFFSLRYPPPPKKFSLKSLRVRKGFSIFVISIYPSNINGNATDRRTIYQPPYRFWLQTHIWHKAQ